MIYQMYVNKTFFVRGAFRTCTQVMLCYDVNGLFNVWLHFDGLNDCVNYLECDLK